MKEMVLTILIIVFCFTGCQQEIPNYTEINTEGELLKQLYLDQLELRDAIDKINTQGNNIQSEGISNNNFEEAHKNLIKDIKDIEKPLWSNRKISDVSQFICIEKCCEFIY